MTITNAVASVLPVTVPVETEEKVPLMFIDREQDRFSVVESNLEGTAVLGLRVQNDDGTDITVEFFKDDAPFIEWMIREGAKSGLTATEVEADRNAAEARETVQ